MFWFQIVNLHLYSVAEAAGADYLGCGAIFDTSTKPESAPVGVAGVAAVAAAVDIPVVAIGGLSARNVGDVMAEGGRVAGAAVVSAVFDKSDIGAAVRSLTRAVRDGLARQRRRQ